MAAASGKVLVVDDAPEVAEVLTTMVEQRGYHAESVGNGREALSRIKSGGVDLVVLDVMLPELDGLELCRHVRAHEHGPHLPIIMLTALGTDTQRHAGFAAGA